MRVRVRVRVRACARVRVRACVNDDDANDHDDQTRKTTKRTMKSTMTSIFRDRMSVYYAVGLGRADSAAHFYGELRNVAEQVVPQLKRQGNPVVRSSV